MEQKSPTESYNPPSPDWTPPPLEPRAQEPPSILNTIANTVNDIVATVAPPDAVAVPAAPPAPTPTPRRRPPPAATTPAPQPEMSNNVYEQALLSKNITVHIKSVGSHIKETLEQILRDTMEGKCTVEGFIKKGSISVINYSSGLIRADYITFATTYTCAICYLVEGMLIQCVATSDPTKAGIRAEHITEKPSPFVVMISRDHHNNSVYFNSIKMGDTFKARVIGQTFELNDTVICIIAELVRPSRAVA